MKISHLIRFLSKLIRSCDTRELWLDNTLFDNACNGIEDSTDIDKDVSDHYEITPEHRHKRKVHTLLYS